MRIANLAPYLVSYEELILQWLFRRMVLTDLSSGRLF
jgi:hypothetical protein